MSSARAAARTLIVGKPPVYADPTKLSDIAADVPPALEETISAGLEMIPEPRGVGLRLRQGARRASCASSGESLAISVERPDAPRQWRGIVDRGGSLWGGRILDRADRRHHRRARLPVGVGAARARDRACGCRPGHVSGSGGQRRRQAVECRTDPRFATQIAAGTGYTPHTLCVPLMRNDRAIGVLSVLDRRDGGLYGPGDMERASCSRTLPSSRSR